MNTENERLLFLDSIRGIAAFIVLMNHTFTCFLLKPLPEWNSIATKIIFFDGYFAVNIFYVLSGLSLSIGFLDTKSYSLLKNLMARRYFRLALPIAVSSLFISIMINYGLMQNLDVNTVIRNDWIALFFKFKAVSFTEWVKFSFYDAVFNHKDSVEYLGISLNPVLWTMPIEFFGSFLVFAMVFIFYKDKRRWLAYWLLMAFFFYANSYMLHFTLGIFLAEVYLWYTKRDNEKSIYNWISVFMISSLLFIYPFVTEYTLRTSGLFSGVLVLLCITNPLICNFLKKPSFLFLGRICFPLYLVHLPIICSATAFMVIYNPWKYNIASATIIGLATIVLSILCAMLFSNIEICMMRCYKKIIKFD